MESRKMVLMNHLQRAWFHDVMVSTLDSESSDPSSSLGGTSQRFVSLFFPEKYCPTIDEINLAYFISCKSKHIGIWVRRQK